MDTLARTVLKEEYVKLTSYEKKLYTDINISRIDNFLNDHLKKQKI